ATRKRQKKRVSTPLLAQRARLAQRVRRGGGSWRLCKSCLDLSLQLQQVVGGIERESPGAIVGDGGLRAPGAGGAGLPLAGGEIGGMRGAGVREEFLELRERRRWIVAAALEVADLGDEFHLLGARGGVAEEGRVVARVVGAPRSAVDLARGCSGRVQEQEERR